MDAVRRWVSWWRAWVERRRQLRLLAMLDDRALRDIGLGRAEHARDATEVRLLLEARTRLPF